jgi:hypothetical protein
VDWDRLNHWLTFLANLGVLIGLIVLIVGTFILNTYLDRITVAHGRRDFSRRNVLQHLRP